MGDFFGKLFSGDGFVARKDCGVWPDELVWLHVGSDLFIWLAYLSIPLVLLYFVRRRQELPFSRLFVLFALFIVCCGFTHFIDALIFYHPVYRASGLMKLITAVVSWTTVLALVPAVPQVLGLMAAVNRKVAADPAVRRELVPPPGPGPRGYIVALLASALALLVRQLLDPLLGDSYPFIISLLAIVYVAWEAGFGPAVLATAIGYLGTAYWFTPPRGKVFLADLNHQVGYGLFVFAGVGCGVLGEAQRRARGRAEEALAVARAREAELEAEIGRREAVEAALRAGEERYRLATEAVAGLVYDADYPAGTVTRSAGLLALTGYDPDEADPIPGWWADRVHPDDWGANTPAVDAAVAARAATLRLEYRVRHRDGRWVWLEDRSRLVYDGGGRVRRLVGCSVDITGRKEGEAALRGSEARFRFLDVLGQATRAEADPEAVMAATARLLGEHLAVTRCAYAEVEADADRFRIRHDWTDGAASTVGDYSLDLFGPRAAADMRAGRTLVVNDVDRELAPAGGADMFNAIGIKAIVCCPYLRDGRLAAMMAVHSAAPRDWAAAEVGLVEQVVERSWAHIERARANRRLGESVERFRVLTEGIPQLVWTCRPDGRCDYLSRQWVEYTGVPEAEQLGYGWLEVLHPDDRGRADAAWQAAVAGRAAYDLDYRIRRHDGEYRWFRTRGTALRTAPDDPAQWFGTCTDIDDQKRQEETLERLVRDRTAALERSNRELQQFASVAGHDLQEPLRKIQAFGDRLRSRFKDQLPESGGEYVDRMLASAGRMTRLIDDLLKYSRVTTQARPFARVDLNAVLADALDDLAHRVEGAGAEVDRGDLPPIDADPGQMRQLLQNLVGNALKFVRPGVRPVVRVRAEVGPDGRPGADVCRLTVADNGIGFDEKYLDRIFQMFQRLHGRDEYDGTGVGLAICKKIADRHGGSITAHSRPGEGAAFVVTLPTRHPARPVPNQTHG